MTYTAWATVWRRPKRRRIVRAEKDASPKMTDEEKRAIANCREPKFGETRTYRFSAELLENSYLSPIYLCAFDRYESGTSRPPPMLRGALSGALSTAAAAATAACGTARVKKVSKCYFESHGEDESSLPFRSRRSDVMAMHGMVASSRVKMTRADAYRAGKRLWAVEP